jgi:hypothetical protein
MAPSSRSRLTVLPTPGAVTSLRDRRAQEVSAGLDFLDLVEVFCSLRILEAWAEMRSLLCEDARLESVASRGVAGPAATIEAMRFAASGSAYTVRDFEIEALGDEAALVRTSISREEHAMTVMTSVHWLVSGRHGLIWRSRLVEDRDEAESVLFENGPGLGV